MRISLICTKPPLLHAGFAAPGVSPPAAVSAKPTCQAPVVGHFLAWLTKAPPSGPQLLVLYTKSPTVPSAVRPDSRATLSSTSVHSALSMVPSSFRSMSSPTMPAKSRTSMKVLLLSVWKPSEATRSGVVSV